MILYEQAREAEIRIREDEVAGRRIAARAIPYLACPGIAGPLFDPVERRFLPAAPDGVVRVGPHRTEAWAQAWRQVPPGPVLVGPSDPAEAIRGAFRAAVEAAEESGRPIYLLDPSIDSLPPAQPGFILLLTIPAPFNLEVARSIAAAAVRRGHSVAWLFPLLPGWTTDEEMMNRFAAAAAAVEARCLAPILPAADPTARRFLFESRAFWDPVGADDEFFRRIYHADWSDEVNQARARLTEISTVWGLATIPPRPRGSSQPAGNAAAAALLEEKAAVMEGDEHRTARLLAAARWIDESGRDLAAIVREGNFRKIFPFHEIEPEAEEALRSVP